jgi:hypothetical protein
MGAVYQTVVRKLSRKKNNAKIVSDTERVRNALVHVCAKTAFVGWPPTESRRILSQTSCPSVIILENTLN